VSDDQNGAVPPRGWDSPGSGPGPSVDDELEAFAALLRQLLETVPDEITLRLTEAARAMLQALRALLDWLAALLGATDPDGPVEVRDIPIL
jgi:hypothetical protein